MFRSAQKTATSSSIPIVDREGDNQTIVIYNDGSADVYLGDSTVTSATGFKVKSGAVFSIDLVGGEEIYAVTSTSSAVLFIARSSAR